MNDTLSDISPPDALIKRFTRADEVTLVAIHTRGLVKHDGDTCAVDGIDLDDGGSQCHSIKI